MDQNFQICLQSTNVSHDQIKLMVDKLFQKILYVLAKLSHCLPFCLKILVFLDKDANAILQILERPPKDGPEVRANLPKNIDILVTHCPPFGIMDVSFYSKLNTGCKALLQAVQKMQPKLHIFGHIHQGHGNQKIGNTHFYNVAYLDQTYSAKQKPVLIELDLSQEKKQTQSEII